MAPVSSVQLVAIRPARRMDGMCIMMTFLLCYFLLWTFPRGTYLYLNDSYLYSQSSSLPFSFLSPTPVFAYGQTSSGKTFTMQGNRATAKNNASRNGVDGITHLAARDIFAQIASDPKHSYAVRVSFLEIYNEEVRDLLVASDSKSGGGSGGGGGNGQAKQATLAVREDPKMGVFVENLTSHRVYNLDTLLHYLNLGEKHKSVAATGMNDRSSRSHTIFRITVERKKKVVVQQSGGAGPAVSLMLTPPPEANNGGGKKRGGRKSGGDGVKLVATLNLVDLAGSESVRHTGATGSRQKEGGKINQR